MMAEVMFEKPVFAPARDLVGAVGVFTTRTGDTEYSIVARDKNGEVVLWKLETVHRRRGHGVVSGHRARTRRMAEDSSVRVFGVDADTARRFGWGDGRG